MKLLSRGEALRPICCVASVARRSGVSSDTPPRRAPSAPCIWATLLRPARFGWTIAALMLASSALAQVPALGDKPAAPKPAAHAAVSDKLSIPDLALEAKRYED